MSIPTIYVFPIHELCISYDSSTRCHLGGCAPFALDSEVDTLAVIGSYRQVVTIILEAS